MLLDDGEAQIGDLIYLAHVIVVGNKNEVLFVEVFYKELKTELGIEPAKHGDLSKWAEQGVLLLNAMLTVEAGQPASHQKIGWQTFTDAVIQHISAQKDGIVFLLWGNFARGKKALIDESKHYVLEAAHPSPLAGNAFQGCGHFAYTNEILRKQGKATVDWSLDG